MAQAGINVWGSIKMRLSARFPDLNFIILIIFGSAWLYSEIIETQMRDEQAWEIHNFMAVGGRFTHEDGDKLRIRIEKLEAEIEKLDYP